MRRDEILRWLLEEDETRLEELWQRADRVRRERVGDEFICALIEISNYCIRQCGYCGLRFGNKELERYRMSEEEILSCVDEAKAYGYGTVFCNRAKIMALRPSGLHESSVESRNNSTRCHVKRGRATGRRFRSMRQSGADVTSSA